jgi:predicted Zn-dependent peptidase
MAGEQLGVFSGERLDNGVSLFHWSTRKFTTASLRLTLHDALDEHTSERALLTGLLKRGTRSWPDMRRVTQRLEELFGAQLALDVTKFGERHMSLFRVEVLADAVAKRFGLFAAGPQLLLSALDLLREVIHEPITIDGAFPRPAFEQEAQNLVHAIEGMLDDKIAYAQQRHVEEMFRGEPYARFDLGEPERVLALDPRAVFEFHQGRAKTAPLDVFVAGAIEDADLAGIREALSRWPREPHAKAPPADIVKPATGPRMITEELPISQSKLLVGHRFDPRVVSLRDQYALSLYNAVLGSGSTSKLFKEVREKRGLAYYAHSIVDRTKGALTLSAGIAARHVEQAQEVMRAQVDAMRAGAFSAEELEISRAGILNALRGVNDSAFQAIEFAATARLTGRLADLNAAAAMVASLTHDDVVRVAALPLEDLTYFLKGTEDHEAAAG